MSWNFLSASALESIVHTLLTTTSFASHSLPAPLLEMRATFAYYVGFGCQQGHKREQEHFRQLIEQKVKDGRVVSQPALRKLDGTLLEVSDLEMLGFQVCILHEDLLAVNGRLIETGVHRCHTGACLRGRKIIIDCFLIKGQETTTTSQK
jgi:hypothetical protein